MWYKKIFKTDTKYMRSRINPYTDARVKRLLASQESARAADVIGSMRESAFSEAFAPHGNGVRPKASYFSKHNIANRINNVVFVYGTAKNRKRVLYSKGRWVPAPPTRFYMFGIRWY